MNEETKQLLLSGGYSNPGYSLECPNCGQRNTIFVQPWLCLSCGIEFTQEDTVMVFDARGYEQDSRTDIEEVGKQICSKEREASQWEELAYRLEH